MTPSEMMAALELDDAAGASKAAEVFGAAEAGMGGAGVAPVSETALELDRWSLRRGAELLGSADFGVERVERDAAGSPDRRAYWEKAVADFHAAAYEPSPELAEKCQDPLRHDFVKTLMETPEFNEVRVSTVLNQAAAECATAAFANQFAARVEEARKAEAQQCSKPAGRDGAPGGKAKKGGAGTDPAMAADIATMKAAAKAVAEAKKAVDEVNDAAAMCGLGAGEPGSPRDLKRITEVYKRVKRSPRLKKIAELAGRFRRVAASKQRQKVAHGVDEVIGVTVGAELARLIPAELMKLADPDLELDVSRRLLEGQTQVREVRAVEPVGRGPIVVVVDESGSMSGTKIETAKALALALAWVARRQNRWVALVGFSGGSTVEPGSIHLQHPRKPDEAGLLAWLEHFFGNGTDLDVPLVELPAMWNEFVKVGMPRGKTDMIMISDGLVRVPPHIQESFNAFKTREKVKLTVLCVQGTGSNINVVADEVHHVPAISPDGEAVGSILSV